MAIEMQQDKFNRAVPQAKEMLTVTEMYGDRREDPYVWLQELDNPEVMRYIDAENEYFDAVLKEDDGLTEEIFADIKKRISELQISSPIEVGEYLYYTKIEKDESYVKYFRRKVSGGAEELVLDLNKLAENQNFCSILSFRPTPDGKHLMYAVDFSGDEYYEIHIKNLESGEVRVELPKITSGACEWGDENYNSIFYTLTDETHRPASMFLHKLGDKLDSDTHIYTQEDPIFSLEIERSLSGNYLYLISESHNSTDLKYLDLRDPNANVELLSPSQSGVILRLGDIGDNFYLQSNKNCVGFQIFKIDVSDHTKCEPIITPEDGYTIEEFLTYEKFIAVKLRYKTGENRVRIYNPDGTLISELELQQPFSSLYFVTNRNYDTTHLRYRYESFVTPPVTVEYDLQSSESRDILTQPIPEYEPENYATDRLYAPSHDGGQVPISIFYNKNVYKKGDSPFFLIGYGAYGIPYDPEFSIQLLALADRGFACGIAHIRGGGELGRQQYLDGKFLKKKNSFYDFISAAEHLVNSGVVKKENLVISGRSAGGLLMGAVLTMRPDLFGVVVAEVPFVDALNTMLDETLPLTVGEYYEWGNPHEREYYEYMRSYSPYDNIKSCDYPAILLFTALHDTRVMYWEPLKFIAKLRKYKTDNHISVLRTECHGGHRGASGRYDSIREKASQYAFILMTLNKR